MLAREVPTESLGREGLRASAVRAAPPVETAVEEREARPGQQDREVPQEPPDSAA